jgi:chromosomal replication initiator protein
MVFTRLWEGDATMDSGSLKTLWSRSLTLLEGEMSDISLKTWITPLEPISAENGDFVLSAPNDFHRTYAEQYVPLIQNTLKSITSRDFRVRISIQGHEAVSLGTGPRTHPPDVVEESGFFPSSSSGRAKLNPTYTFENFVVGSGNRFAHAACVAVADKPGGRNFNPLFMYGGSGLGKTHLMHAIGNYIRTRHKETKLLFVQCEQFVNEFIFAIKENRYEEFRTRYRGIDVLLIDDIQFIEGKEQMQIEFFHTFNALYESGKHIILTCDKPPQSLTSLESRLRTRFASGLIVDIQPPDYETRIVILKKRAQSHGVDVPEDVLDYISSHIASNVRELEGAFNTVLAYSLLAGGITLEVARDALKDIIQPSTMRKVTCPVVMDVVARYYGLGIEDLRSNRRSKEVSDPRQIAMYLCRTMLDMTFPQIGNEFGNRDHSTVMHACSKVTDALAGDQPGMRSDLDEIRKRVNG